MKKKKVLEMTAEKAGENINFNLNVYCITKYEAIGILEMAKYNILQDLFEVAKTTKITLK
jgi:hypothetical protein